jgi:hypothetical protein
MYVVLGITHAAHLLTLLTDYLSLKLPYEIIPPSRGISYPCIRSGKTQTSKPLALYLPPDSFSSPTSPKSWAGKKIKDTPGLESLIEAISLFAWDIAWVLWTQELWPPNARTAESPTATEACRFARNLGLLVSSGRIGRISHGSTIGFIPAQEALGVLGTFELKEREVMEVIVRGLEEDKSGDIDAGGWDMVEGGDEVLRGEGWLKLHRE